MENSYDPLVQKLEGLIDELEESRDIFCRLAEERPLGQRVSREECDTFLRFYKLNITFSVLVDSAPILLEDENVRNIYLVAKRNTKYLDCMIRAYFTGEEPLGLD